MTTTKPRPRDLTKEAQQTVNADSYNRSSTVVYSDWQRYVLGGRMPYTCRAGMRSNAPLKDMTVHVPEGMEVVRQDLRGKDAYQEIVLAVNERTAMLLERNQQQVDINVAGATMDEARNILLDITAKIPTVETPEHIIDAWVWFLTHDGPRSSLKKLNVPSWPEIERNYVPKVSGALTDMMALHKPEACGKIILWHGEPGTGKTTALRALAREWKKWCSFHYISDPERFFAEPEYLLEVGSTPANTEIWDDEDEDDESVPRPPTWRLVVAEDSDEFLKFNAREQAGAALGRLLNFSDGILGQGSNTLILLTTNEKIDKLHPAIVRPGRCLAQIEFESFDMEQARAWFGDEAKGVTGLKEKMTLAEMIEKREGQAHQIATGVYTETHGTYL